jgi:LCP family protein required for cell wall assembly
LKKFAIWTAAILFLLIAGGSIYVYSMLNQIKQVPLVAPTAPPEPGASSQPASTPRPLTPEDLGITEDSPDEQETEVINILLFGLDRRSREETSRSDTIMIATIDKKNKTLKLTSLMRDMYVPIPGKADNRINAAYAFGGAALAIQTINTNFRLDITRYITVDFFALEQIIDRLGGVSLTITPAEAGILGVSSGLQTLNGEQAVRYSRIRKIGNDYERTKRQRTVISEMFKKAKDIHIIQYPDLIATFMPHIETNMSKMEIMSLALQLSTFKREIQQYRLPVDGTFQSRRIRGKAVLVPDIEENTQLLKQFIYNQ